MGSIIFSLRYVICKHLCLIGPWRNNVDALPGIARMRIGKLIRVSTTARRGDGA